MNAKLAIMKILIKSALLILLCIICATNVLSQEKQEFKFENGTTAYWVRTDSGWGVEDAFGKIIIPKKYKKLYRYGNLIYCNQREDGEKTKYICVLYDYQGNCKISEEDGLSSLDFVKSNGKWIATNSKNKTVFDENGNIKYKFKTLKDVNGYNYLINELTNEIVIDSGIFKSNHGFQIKKDYIITYSAYSFLNNKQGVVNFDGTNIIPAIYEMVLDDTKNNRTVGFTARLSKGDGPIAYYDRTGKCIFPAYKYTNIYTGVNNTYKVKENDFIGITDSVGNVKFMTKYRVLNLRKDNDGNLYYETRLGNGVGKMTLDGEIIEEPQPSKEEKPVTEKDGFKYIKIWDVNGLYGINDEFGRKIIPSDYDMIQYTTLSHMKLSGFKLYKNGFQGFADKTGRIIINCNKYHYITDDIDGNYFIVDNMGRYGVCDRTGREIAKPIYDMIDIYDGTIIASIGSMKGVLDNQGKVIVPIQYTNISPKYQYDKNHKRIKTDHYEVELMGKKGICGQDGKIIIPANYTSIFRTNDPDACGPYKAIYEVNDGNTEGIYSIDGRMIFPTSFFNYVSIEGGKYTLTKIKNHKWFIQAYNENDEFLTKDEDGEDYMEVNYHYYDINGKFLFSEKGLTEYDEYFDHGQNEFNKQNYIQAINDFEQALKIRESASAYYNIAASHFNMKNYKEAINYFKLCKKTSDSQSLSDEASYYIKLSEQNLQQKRQQNAAAVISVIASALNVANTIYHTNNAISSYNSNLSKGLDNTANRNYLLDPNYAIYQVEQQNWNEYLQMTNGGTTMTYQEYINIKARAYAESQSNNSYESSSSTTNTTTSTNNTISVDHKCSRCNGTGRIVYDTHPTQFGLQDTKVKCNECGEYHLKSTGHTHITCPQCGGKGHW